MDRRIFEMTVGDGQNSRFRVEHNLGATLIWFEAYDLALPLPQIPMEVTVESADINGATVSFPAMEVPERNRVLVRCGAPSARHEWHEPDGAVTFGYR